MSAVRFLPPLAGTEPDADRLPDVPHPREMLSLLGHEEAEALFLSGYTSGKLHHAFILSGPQGVGKATFAYRAARFLLAESERDAMPGMFGPVEPETLALAEGSRTAQIIAGQAHPDLGVIQRRYDSKTKKFRAEIGVADTREALQLFEKTAAFGGWRVIIVDSADDLNRDSANALLKMLEEPPARAVFFLVTHRIETLLPTIRSRCQVLRFRPLAGADMRTLIAAFGGAKGREADVIARAEGSIRAALRLSEGGQIDILADIERALSTLPARSVREIDRIADRMRAGQEAGEVLATFLASVETWLAAGMHRRISAGPRAAEPFAECWARLQDRAARVDAFNLDKRAFVIATFEELAALERR